MDLCCIHTGGYALWTPVECWEKNASDIRMSNVRVLVGKFVSGLSELSAHYTKLKNAEEYMMVFFGNVHNIDAKSSPPLKFVSVLADIRAQNWTHFHSLKTTDHRSLQLHGLH